MFLNYFEELSSLVRLKTSLFYCRERNGLNSKAFNWVQFDFPSATALVEEGAAWRRLKDETMEELLLVRDEEAIAQMADSMAMLRLTEKKLRRGYEERLRDKTRELIRLERRIESCVQKASVGSFRLRHLEQLQRGYCGGSAHGCRWQVVDVSDLKDAENTSAAAAAGCQHLLQSHDENEEEPEQLPTDSKHAEK